MKLDQIGSVELVRRPQEGESRGWTVHRVLALIKRHRFAIFVPPLLLLIAGALFVLARPPSYTARGSLLIENIRFDSGRQELLPTMNTVETSTLDSQIQLLGSDAFALKVIERVRLHERPEFTAEPRSWIPRLALFGADRPRAEPSAVTVLPVFHSRLAVRRVGASAVIEITYRSADPAEAADVVNELIQVYIADQTATAATAASAASAWLRERIKDLGARSRVIDLARPPPHTDGPRRLVVVGAFTGLGLLLGLALAVGRELFDGSLRDPHRARELLGGTFLGAIPTLPSRKTARRLVEEFRSLAGPAPKAPSPGHGDFAPIARRIGVAGQGKGSIVGIRCTIPGEGTTTVAANLAFSAARAGHRVLLVDCNPNRVLSRKLAPDSKLGLTDLLDAPSSPEEALRKPPGSPLHFLPFGSRQAAPSPRHAGLLRHLAEGYELVLLDMAPMVDSEAESLADALNELVLVVEWGRTPASLVESGLKSGGLSQKAYSGFLFNKVKRSQVDRSAFPLEFYRWTRS